MSININVKHKFRINGKEYSSTDEMPADVREIFQKAMASRAGSGQHADAAATRTKIIFNGTEYESIDKMPQDVRQLYEKVLKAAETGAPPSELAEMAELRRSLLGQGQAIKTRAPAVVRSPPKTEPAFSLRTVLVGVVLAAVFLLLYYLVQHR